VISTARTLRGSAGEFESCASASGAHVRAVCWKLKDEDDSGFTLYDFASVLRSRGWQVPAYSMPANRKDLVIQRILVRHGVSRDLASLLLDDIKRAMDFFEQHEIHATMTAEEAGGFKH
jgi:glutamate decarboxylase